MQVGKRGEVFRTLGLDLLDLLGALQQFLMLPRREAPQPPPRDQLGVAL